MKLKITDEKLRIKMNKLIESKFDTDSVTQMYHKLFVDMAAHGFRAAEQTHQVRVDKLIEIIETQRQHIICHISYIENAHKRYIESEKEKVDFSLIMAPVYGIKIVLAETDKMMKELKWKVKKNNIKNI